MARIPSTVNEGPPVPRPNPLVEALMDLYLDAAFPAWQAVLDAAAMRRCPSAVAASELIAAAAGLADVVEDWKGLGEAQPLHDAPDDGCRLWDAALRYTALAREYDARGGLPPDRPGMLLRAGDELGVALVPPVGNGLDM